MERFEKHVPDNQTIYQVRDEAYAKELQIKDKLQNRDKLQNKFSGPFQILDIPNNSTLLIHKINERTKVNIDCMGPYFDN